MILRFVIASSSLNIMVIKLEGSDDENFRLPGVAGELGDDVRVMWWINLCEHLMY